MAYTHCFRVDTRVGEHVEHVVIGVEGEHRTVVCNHLKQAGLLLQLIVVRKVCRSDVHTAVGREFHHKRGSGFVAVGKILHHPAVGCRCKHIGILHEGVFDTVGSRIVEDVLYFVLTRCRHQQGGGYCCRKKYLGFHIYQCLIGLLNVSNLVKQFVGEF